LPVDIHHVRPGDEWLLMRVAPDVFDHEINDRQLAAYLANPGHMLLIALADGEVIGQARGIVHLHPDADPELYVDNLGVAEDWRRQGIARRLMLALYDLGRSAGCTETWVGTEPDNEPAKALYASLGGGHEPIAMFAGDL
jgi:ribosomal protein S18 acetylase RimI-like enzyme